MEKNRFPLIMKSIAIITTLCTFLFILLYFRLQQGWILSCAITFGTTAYHFVMRLCVGYIVPKLTNYAFDYRDFWFQPDLGSPLSIKNCMSDPGKPNFQPIPPRNFLWKRILCTKSFKICAVQKSCMRSL